MRLVEYVRGRDPRLGVVREGLIYDAAAAGGPTRMLAFLEGGAAARQALENGLGSAAARGAVGRFGEVRLGPPLPNPPKLLCVAANYDEHIRECGFAPIEAGGCVTPQFFAKFPSTCITGPGAPIPISTRNVAPDWELELAVVIGRKGKHIAAGDALGHVFGYTIINDISERKLNSDLSNRVARTNDGFFDWLNGKWFDGFAPLGPAIVTADEVPDPQALELRLEVNGELMQHSTTGKMITPVAQLIAWISEYVTLEPGDIIATGTPDGVGLARGRFLAPGDVVRGSIEGLGCLENPVVAESAVAAGDWGSPG
ncbi:MAG TPA: fumarylacetoacetate hydrolase family protein [Bryobacteraceae bacterium]|nr:fumarylacetoacetate hydrolase family protein [Bryobacteraceae bacterium]